MNNNVKLSDQQKTIILENESNFVVKASAGTGKTTVLVHRYLNHVLNQGVSPEKILCITFTKKAAAEMKQRIVNSLIDSKHTELAALAETGPIQTLHSFCESILRENALYANLDPNFTILDDADTTTKIEKSITNVLDNKVSSADSFKDNPYIQKLLFQLAGEQVYGFTPSILSKVSREIRALLHAFRNTLWTKEALSNMYHSPEQCLSTWKSCIFSSLQIDTNHMINPDNHTWELWKSELTRYLKENKIKIPRWFASNTDSKILQDGADTSTLVSLTIDIWKELETLMLDEQAFDFSFLESKASSLLKDHLYVKERIHKKYSVVMVDESQDLNPIQYDLLKSLKPEMQMMVGDPKQSIYRFRNADYKLFTQETKNTHLLPLTTNYRSQTGILNYADDFFYNHWKSEYQPFQQDPISSNGSADPFNGDDETSCRRYSGIEYWEHAKFDASFVSKKVQDLLSTTEYSPSDIAILCRKTSSASEISKELEQNLLPNTILGGSEKFYTKLEIKDLFHCLKALIDPSNDFSLICVLRSPIVGLSMESIAYLSKHKPVYRCLLKYSSDYPQDNDKLHQFLSWFPALQSSISQYTAWEIIHQILHKSEYQQKSLSTGNVQAYANTKKILSIACQKKNFTAEMFAHYIADIQLLNHKEGEANIYDPQDNTIKILTIHKSKGLEFPVVILPDHYGRIQRSMPGHYFDASSGLVSTRYNLIASTPFRKAHEKNQIESYEEELRILYVAFTRAKEKLCLLTHSAQGTDTIASIIQNTISKEDLKARGGVVRQKAKEMQNR